MSYEGPFHQRSSSGSFSGQSPRNKTSAGLCFDETWRQVASLANPCISATLFATKVCNWFGGVLIQHSVMVELLHRCLLSTGVLRAHVTTEMTFDNNKAAQSSNLGNVKVLRGATLDFEHRRFA
ncbi:unnamed protein product [Lasius platythorax]|uniref:Uncharacterized protein n=1 Tax=Lasius platythorax TaxID=488582 RepID=A0AAV2NH54_9HYME